MSYVILKPTYVVSECFLAAARDWIAFYRFPTKGAAKDRAGYVIVDDEKTKFPLQEIDRCSAEFDAFECKRIGVPIHPDIEACFDDDDWPTESAEFYEYMISQTAESAEKQQLIQSLAKAKILHDKKHEWYEQILEKQELAEAKLFAALKEGKIIAFGRVPQPHHKNDIIPLADQAFHMPGTEHQNIPTTFWRGQSIDWNSSKAFVDKTRYVHIYVQTKNLFDIFPLPSASSTSAVKLISGNYVLDTTVSGDEPVSSKVGRPSMNWQEFLFEVHDRFTKGNIPKKQESFIAEMQEWCMAHWGITPGRSTILEKVKPYYDARSEKKND